MVKSSALPRHLYKYRAFNAHTLRLLSEAEVYYADPAGFNDPLDCRPVIRSDTDLDTLEKVCYCMLELAHGKERALASITNHRYMSSEHGDYKVDSMAAGCYTQDLRSEIEHLLYAEMRQCGVLSLAARWNCPLMWSHYADEHRGLCIEYDSVDHHCESLLPVKYTTSGEIKVSDVYRWKIGGAEDAEALIRSAFFYAKAHEWRYEREWRDVAKSTGARESTLRSISSVYFGMRCDRAVATAVVMLYSDRGLPIKFFDICRGADGFRLLRVAVDVDEIKACGLRTPVSWDFEVLDGGI